MAGFGRLVAVEADRRQGASKAENYGRGPWQEGLRNSTLYITLVALQYKYILAVALRKPKKGDFKNPKIYRLIALLNIVGKIMDKVLVK